jgi:hypothetical protein
MSYSTTTTPRTSVELTKEAITSSSTSIAAASSPGKTHGIWTFVKRYAKEHHEATNAAYATYYGQGQRTMQRQEIWEYKRGGKN